MSRRRDASSQSSRGNGGRAQRVIKRRPSFVGWRTSDEEEVTRRRWRGMTEVVAVEPLNGADPFFGRYRVRSVSGGSYEVEIRSLDSHENSCGCLDHVVNGLGTCKHIEGTLYALRRGRARAFDQTARHGCAWAEVYVSRRDAPVVRLMWPADQTLATRLHQHLGGWFSDEGALLGDPLDALPALRQVTTALPMNLHRHLRWSQHVETWLDSLRRREETHAERDRFLSEIQESTGSLDPLLLPLLPYQREGMQHLALKERALLADEMGLGKTVQAIAACVLLQRHRGIERVLVVAPASLKAEWQDQIARFTNLPVEIVEGDRAARLRLYQKSAFFYLANYEQILPDGPEINEMLRPDVVIVDEAQRIKNWRAKTAGAVKGLKSRYAFVLTGTPLENRIDEVYSIVQYLDPGLLGPLFRFNRTFYELDERGRPVGYQNLEELHRRLQPIMLRRRKCEVEDQLPERTIKTHLVAMDDEQRLRYDEYEGYAARLVAIARQRGLSPEEFERLQRWLACMRMLCDTPYILDTDCRVCPKLEELENLLTVLLDDPDCKIIIFSEWVRMLELVGELAREMDLDVAWHTGSVPQKRRRIEIRRFKEDPFCRLFLSSDAGSVGLNLQAASVVINLDLPWNPAKLEQRIARAWRKYQTRPVRVINLVTEDSIEHRMLDVLAFKRELADGVLDGLGDLSALRMASGRAAFLDRLDEVMGDADGDGPVLRRRRFSVERLRSDLLERHGDDLLLLESRRDDSGQETVLAVIDVAPDTLSREADHLLEVHGVGGEPGPNGTPKVELLDRAGFTMLRRLIQTGIVRFASKDVHRLHEAPEFIALVPTNDDADDAPSDTGTAAA